MVDKRQLTDSELSSYSGEIIKVFKTLNPEENKVRMDRLASLREAFVTDGESETEEALLAWAEDKKVIFALVDEAGEDVGLSYVHRNEDEDKVVTAFAPSLSTDQLTSFSYHASWALQEWVQVDFVPDVAGNSALESVPIAANRL